MTALLMAWDLFVPSFRMTPRRVFSLALFNVFFWVMPRVPGDDLLLLAIAIAVPVLFGLGGERSAARIGYHPTARVASALLFAAAGAVYGLVLVGGVFVVAVVAGPSLLERWLKTLIPAADPTVLSFALFMLVFAAAFGEGDSSARRIFLSVAVGAAILAFLGRL